MTQPEGTRPFHGRNIKVRELMPGQLAVLARLTAKLRRGDGTNSETLTYMGKVTDLLYSAIAKEDDQEFVEDLMLKGEADLKELMVLVRPEDAEDAPPPNKVRRGRPPKRVAA